MKNIDDHIGMKLINLLASRIIILEFNTIHIWQDVYLEPTMLNWWEGFQ